MIDSNDRTAVQNNYYSIGQPRRTVEQGCLKGQSAQLPEEAMAGQHRGTNFRLHAQQTEIGLFNLAELLFSVKKYIF